MFCFFFSLSSPSFKTIEQRETNEGEKKTEIKQHEQIKHS